MQNKSRSQFFIQRQKKLAKIKSLGFEVYPYSFSKTHSVRRIWENEKELLENETKISIAGRILATRKQGKAAFYDLHNQDQKIQLYISQKKLGTVFELVNYLDIGDWIGVTGCLFKTQLGMTTVKVQELKLLSKSLHPFPIFKEKELKGEKIIYDQFSDQETRYRKRYLDIVLNKENYKIFQNRSLIIRSVRDYLESKEFIEVETPTLQSIYGGANARPFETYHETHQMKLYLRIANELYLKRCIIGGMEKVYEIVKNFRNEGIDRTHSPEFTMVEFYQAFVDYEAMMKHCENIFHEACMKIHNQSHFIFDNKKIDLTIPWKRQTMKESILEYTNIDVDKVSDEIIKEMIENNKITSPIKYNRGLAICSIFDHFCACNLIQPTFITDYPKESTPLCRLSQKNSDLLERTEAYIGGLEVANIYSELNDPVLQKKLLEQQENRGKSDDAHPMDNNFIEAMEYGMPPTGGIGIGIDRMVMLLNNKKNIRDVILFPLLKT